MPRSFGTAPTQSATDIAAALMTEDDAPQPAAQGDWPNLEETPQEQPEAQPERGPRRDASGRFVPRDQSVPTEQGEQPQPTGGDTQEPQEPEEQVDYRAELERQRAETERLRRTYENNTRQQREALEAARREAEELRTNQQAERQRLFEQARAEVDAMPENDPRKAAAERQLAAVERQEAERIRREVEAERQEAETARQQQQQQQADSALRVGSWGVVEAYAEDFSRRTGLDQRETQAALEAIKTPELAIIFRTMPADQLVAHVRDVVGPRLHDELERRATSRTERNRQAAVASGTHAHPRTPSAEAPAPAYTAYTRENKNIRLGRNAAVEAILAGMLEE